jgi:alcohol dehydrogenase YqhD (iron-dependent ADH family)
MSKRVKISHNIPFTIIPPAEIAKTNERVKKDMFSYKNNNIWNICNDISKQIIKGNSDSNFIITLVNNEVSLDSRGIDDRKLYHDLVFSGQLNDCDCEKAGAITPANWSKMQTDLTTRHLTVTFIPLFL